MDFLNTESVFDLVMNEKKVVFFCYCAVTSLYDKAFFYHLLVSLYPNGLFS